MRKPIDTTLRVDPIACDGYGYCAELLPELIALDEWGFPRLADQPVPPALMDLARRAVADCPRRALVLVEGRRPTAPATHPGRVVLATYRDAGSPASEPARLSRRIATSRGH